MPEVSDWLKGLGLDNYAATFAENAVDWEVLPELTNDDLTSMGVLLGHRKKLLKAIASLPSSDDVPTVIDATKQAPVQTAPEHDAERRQLTVMFCDLVGSTELSTRFDPEDLREMIVSYQQACTEVIKQYEGFIARYMGDGMLVYFGYPSAHENDAERAARAGLAIVDAIQKVSAAYPATMDVELAVRIGIDTGLVVVGDIIGEGAAEEASVVGETPNVAARLQGLAQSNQVIIGPLTHNLIGELFICQDLGEQELKGINEPVRALHVTGLKEMENLMDSESPVDGITLVGRDEEIGLLRRRWEQSKEGLGQAVFILGEPGIGKSALIETIGAQVRSEDLTRVTMRCSVFHTNSPLYPVITHLQNLLRLQAGDSNKAKLAKLETALQDFSMELEEAVPLFADLFSIPLEDSKYALLNLTPQQQKQQTMDAIVAWLLEEAERQPVLQVWEDLHWADSSTLELLTLEIEQQPTAPILNVLTFRPDFSPPWPHRSHMTPLTLNRLERADVEALITRRAGGKLLPQEVVEYIVSKTDGVPLYVEELTKAILEADFLREEGDHYSLTGKLSEVTIPTTLQETLMARLDRLPSVREVAQLGAVLGREFAYDMLEALVEVEEAVLQDGLGQLVDAELLYQRGRPPRAKYIFKHALIQDAAYQSLLRRSRQQYHRQVAELMETRFPEIVEAQPELVAHHYAGAGIADAAVKYWQRAGTQALQRSATPEGIGHLNKALESLSALPESSTRNEQELDILLPLGVAYIAAKGYGAPEVAETYQQARELCEQIGETPRLFPALRGLWNSWIFPGYYAMAHKLGEELVEFAKQSADTALQVEAYRVMGTVLYFLGESTTAQQHLEQGIALYDAERHQDLAYVYGADPSVVCQLYAALNLWLRGFPQQAKSRMDQALAKAKELAHAHTLAFALAYSSNLCQFLNLDQETLQQAESAIAFSDEHGFAQWAAYGTVLRGWALAVGGQRVEGVAQIHKGLDDMRITGAEVFRPYFLTLLSDAYLKGEQFDEGLRAVAEALEILDSAMDDTQGFCRPELDRLKGEIMVQSSDDVQQAVSQFRQSLNLAQSRNLNSLALRAAMSLSKVLTNQGNHAEASKILEQVINKFSEGRDTLDLKNADTLLRKIDDSL